MLGFDVSVLEPLLHGASISSLTVGLRPESVIAQTNDDWRFELTFWDWPHGC
jgi:hypothetical protein